MKAGRRLRALTSLAGLLVAVSAVQSASADGEVGLVIEENGQVRTYCIPFEGDSMSGQEILQASGLSYEDVGTGAGAILCAIEETGCFDASSYNTCWCECQSGGSDCVYWAFFTRDYGAGWVYSARAFNRVEADDGDVQAWKWGAGGPSSAPAPSSSLTFESVCGHSPRGGAAASQPSPTPPQPTTAPSTRAPGATVPSTAAPDSTPAANDTPFTAAPGTASPTTEVSVTFTAQQTPLAPDTADSPRDDDNDDGGSPTTLIAFGAVAAFLVSAIAAGAYWRRTHGA